MIARAFSLVSVLCISALLFAGATAKDITQKADRRGKPDRPGKPGDVQWMEFRGELEGAQPVEGCCPNAGPFPTYTMTITSGPLLRALEITASDEPSPLPATFVGHLFFNRWGVGKHAAFIVQFWTDEDSDNPFAIVVRGGVFEEEDGVDPGSTITFKDVYCQDLSSGTTPETQDYFEDPLTGERVKLNFTLVRWQCSEYPCY